MKKLFKKNRTAIKTVEDTFQANYYQIHNIARLNHLDSLGIDFRDKTILEIGAGVGDHTYFLLIKGGIVTATDARPELVERIKSRFNIDAFVLDVEKDLSTILTLKKFDIIYCYGLLYHIGNPAEFITSLKGKTDLFLLETCVSSDKREEGAHIVDENSGDPTQATSGKGCRPSRKWLEKELKKSFQKVYFPFTQPKHPQFPNDWSEDFEDRIDLKRAVFIASEKELNNPMLTTELPVLYK